MSCRRARVKIKIGMVTFSHPCVYRSLEIYIKQEQFDFQNAQNGLFRKKVKAPLI